MRQLQLHEYLEYLDESVATQETTPALSASALRIAEEIWPTLRLGEWSEHPREVATVARCESSGKRLVHVSADWANCFLILVFSPELDEVDEFILFDIGAEYSEARLTGPEMNVETTATRSLIEETLPKLQHVDKDPFAILDVGNGTYMQTLYDSEEAGFVVEHQLVSLAAHYKLPKLVDASTVVKLFLSYAFGKKEWARDFVWERIDLNI